jgi:NAD(P)H-hydrate epimerase
LGLDDDGRRLSVALARRLPVPTVLDADALTALAEEGVSALRDAAAPRVLTPHPGEAARLLGHTASTVQSDRYAAAAELAEASQQVVVLKGAGTVVAIPSGPSFVCGRGTPALAVAGTGDVLSGLVAARLAGAEASVAAPVAVVLHALAGELAARSDAGLLARELADAFPAAVERCREPSGGHPAGDR